MKRHAGRTLVSFWFSIMISFMFFVAGSRLLFADRTTTTVTTTTTTMPSTTIQPPLPPAVLVPAAVSARQIRESISIDIEIKKIFQSNENVHGWIIVANSSSAYLADSFTVRLYHDNRLFKTLLTRITKIPPGRTRFSFEDFGIPQINSSAAAQGDWTLSIYDTDPSLSRDVDFRIIQSTNSNNLLR